jgi:type III secretion protein V
VRIDGCHAGLRLRLGAPKSARADDLRTSSGLVPAYLIAKDIEDAVRGAVRQTSGASYLALSPDVHRQLITSMRNVVGAVSQHAMPPAMLAPMDIRRFMRKIVERDFPDLAVLSYQELAPSANVQPLERIKLVMQISAA